MYRKQWQLHHLLAINMTECTNSSKYLLCKVLCKIINLRFIFAIDYTQSKEQHLNQWVKEKDPTSCIILSLLYLSMYFTSQQLCLYRYIARTRPVDQHTYWTHSQCNTLSDSQFRWMKHDLNFNCNNGSTAFQKINFSTMSCINI